MNSNIEKIFNKLFISHLFLNITNCLCNIASGYIAGNLLNSIALSCSSIVNPFNSIIFGISTIHSSAGEILCGKYMGIGDKKAINKTFSNVVITTLLAGIIITIFSLTFTKPLLLLLGASSEILDAALSYFRAYSLGISFIILMPVLVSFLHMENQGTYVTISVVLLALSYALFGFFFIKILNLSYFGFGLTNTCSQLITVIFLLFRIVKCKNQISFDIKEFDLKFIGNMYTLGFSAGTAGMMIGFRNIILNKTLMQTGGVIALAGYSVCVSSICIIDALITSVLQTCIMISSICVGERNIDDLKSLVKYLFSKVWPIFLIIMSLQFVSTRIICSFFSNEIDVVLTASKISRIYLPSTILEILSDALISIYTILDYKKFASFFNAMHCFIVHCLFIFLFKSIIGEYAVFLGYIVTEITCFIILMIFVTIKQKRVPHNSADLIITNNDFVDVIKYQTTINDINQVVNISEDITNYCLKNNIDSRRSKLSGLFIEEMIVNIFEHGFTKKNVKDKKIDVFLLIENNNITVRIRDNSIAFDPTSRSIIFNPLDPCKNIGLRMVSKLSNEMTYQSVFGFNNMIIKI